jgi:hypothetical protein
MSEESGYVQDKMQWESVEKDEQGKAPTLNPIEKATQNPSKEEQIKQTSPQTIEDGDLDKARILWKASITEYGGAITRWRLFTKSNLEYDEVGRFLKYFKVVRKEGHKNIYKWDSQKWQTPEVKEPDLPIVEYEEPKNIKASLDGIEFTQAGYIERALEEKEEREDEQQNEEAKN